jgi:broad specificity phosphatase PhoE
MLKNAGIQAVYSTATKRTEQTAQPLAQLLGLSVQRYEATEADLPAKLATRSQGKRVLVVSHSNLLPKILNAYTQSEKYTVSDDYGDLFLLRLAGRQPASVVRLRF